jgi:plasmid stabilization system protein ParE
MAGKKVDWTANALAMVSDIYDYLEDKAGEDMASEYIDELLEYGNNLDEKSEHFSFCQHPKLQQKGYRCAQFRKTYVLIYKENSLQVNILAVIHVKRSPEVFGEV